MNIPQWTRKESIPAVSGNAMADPEAMSKPWQALAIAGKQVGDKYLDIFADMQSKIEAANVLNTRVEHDRATLAFKTQMEQVSGGAVYDMSQVTKNEADKGKDLFTYSQEVLDTMAGTFRDKLGSSSEKELFDDLAVGANHSILLNISTHQASEGIKYRGQTIENLYQAGVNIIGAAPLGQIDQIMVEQTNKIGTAIDALFPGNEELKKAYFNKVITATQSIRENNVITQEIVELKTKYALLYPGEPEEATNAAIREAESPEFIQRVGENKQRTIISSLTTEWKRLNDAYRIEADEISGKLLQKLNNRTLTNDDIMNSGLRAADQARIMSWQRSEQRADQAEARASRSEKRDALRELRIEKKEKSEQIQGELYAKIANDEDVSVQDIYDYIPKGLLPTAARGLASDLGKLQGDPALKEGIKVIDTFAKYGGFDANIGKNAMARGKAIIDLREMVISEGLKGNEIIDAANKIIGPKKENKIKKWLEGIFSPGTPTYSQEDLEYTAKKNNMTVEEVKRRLGVE